MPGLYLRVTSLQGSSQAACHSHNFPPFASTLPGMEVQRPAQACHCAETLDDQTNIHDRQLIHGHQQHHARVWWICIRDVESASAERKAGQSDFVWAHEQQPEV